MGSLIRFCKENELFCIFSHLELKYYVLLIAIYVFVLERSLKQPVLETRAES
jgi:hypothetical protein